MAKAINTREAAELIGCSAAVLRKWRRKGEGPRFFRAGRLIRYRIEDVEAWIQQKLAD